MEILAASTVVLYILGMYLMSQYFPYIDYRLQEEGNRGPLSSGEKVRYLVGWPLVVFKDMLVGDTGGQDAE